MRHWPGRALTQVRRCTLVIRSLRTLRVLCMAGGLPVLIDRDGNHPDFVDAIRIEELGQLIKVLDVI